MDRRTLMKRMVHLGGVAATGAVVVPAGISALSPVLGDDPVDDMVETWQPLGALSEFPIATVREATLTLATSPDGPAEPMPAKGLYVWRPTEEQVVVFSRACTDLGCPVTWDPGSRVFFCPCHGGIFAQNGERMAGPPPRPLYRYATRVRDGLLEIDLRSVPPMV